MATDEKAFSCRADEQHFPRSGRGCSRQALHTLRRAGELLVELSPTAASNKDWKKLPVLYCVYSNNESLEEGVRNI